MDNGLKKPNNIICVICKNEEKYIKDFVKYHLNIGFSKIIIGDNNDEDCPYDYYEILKEYVDAGNVCIFNLRGKKGMQLRLYNHVINTQTYDWCAFIDCDEYITIPYGAKHQNVNDYLASLPENVKAIKLNWKVYGDNDMVNYEERDVADRFIMPMPLDFRFMYQFPENYHVKTILRGGVKAFFRRTPHSVEDIQYHLTDGSVDPHPDWPFSTNVLYSHLYIRHFYTKTIEEWVKYKMNRGYADNLMVEKENTYKLEAFFKYNKVTPEKLNFLKEHGIEYQPQQ